MSEPQHFKNYVGGASEGSVPAIRSAAVGPRPPNPSYTELVGDAHCRWAIAVAENLVWLAAQPSALHGIDSCWVDTELAICVQYSNRPSAYGESSTSLGRFGFRARAEISPISGALHPGVEDRVSGFASKQASNLLDVQMAGGPPDPDDVRWVDPEGREWWGAEPVGGWATVGESPYRLVEISMIE